MASVTTAIANVDDYFSFLAAQPEPARFELYRGEPVAMSPVGYPHAARVAEIIAYLMNRLPRHTYRVVGGEVAIVLEESPLTIRAIDVAVLYKPEQPIKGALREPVLLAIEVVSPSDQSAEIERKRVEYERFGIQEIWIVYEDTKTVHVSQPAREISHFIASEQDGFQSLLGLEVRVENLFS